MTMVIFLKEGVMTLHEGVEHHLREHGKSVDIVFREVIAC